MTVTVGKSQGAAIAQNSREGAIEMARECKQRDREIIVETPTNNQRCALFMSQSHMHAPILSKSLTDLCNYWC